MSMENVFEEFLNKLIKIIFWKIVTQKKKKNGNFLLLISKIPKIMRDTKILYKYGSGQSQHMYKIKNDYIKSINIHLQLHISKNFALIFFSCIRYFFSLAQRALQLLGLASRKFLPLDLFIYTVDSISLKASSSDGFIVRCSLLNAGDDQ